MSKQDELDQLIQQVREGSNEEVNAAIVELRKREWLTDGSMRYADLNKANLRTINLSGADLRGANLFMADLSRADLSYADLLGADLSFAYLESADLTQASLSGAQLHKTDLRDADFTFAACGSTVFSDVDLSSVRSLETVQHYQPSTIGINTIYRSHGHISEEFLKRCGVPELMITYIPSIIAGAQAITFLTCFISYSHQNMLFVSKLHDRLASEGVRCYRDEKNIKVGERISRAVDRAIDVNERVILCCSKQSLNSSWVTDELDRTFDKERSLQKEDPDAFILLPIDIDGYLFSDECRHEYKSKILSRRVASFKGWNEKDSIDIFEDGVPLLLQALEDSTDTM